MDTGLSVDEIYQILEGEIVSLEIKPGEMLSENTLCKRFSISRTPVRSALQRLEQNRFVQIIPHKGTIVTPINLHIANQLIYQRVAVESMVFRDFVKVCTPPEAEQARYRLRMLEEAGAKRHEPGPFDINDFLHRDLAMHEIWFRSTDKMYLWEQLIKPDADYSRFIRLDIVGARNVPDVLENHQEMMQIIDTKNLDAIEPLMMQHLYGGLRRLGGKIFSDEYREYFE